MSNDVLLRLVVVVVAAAVVIGVARFRPRRRRWPLKVEGNLTGPGVYLFTAAACDSCDAARAVYVGVLGEQGFTELTWDDHPELLTGLGVAEIPVSTVLDASGHELCSFVGVPRRAGLRRAVRKMRA